MDGLSTQDELFAIRLLELARHVAPRGNRVAFVNSCETEGIRSFLERFPDLWEQITDNPVREGIVSKQAYTAQRTAYSLQVAAFQELVRSQLELAGVRHLWVGGLTLAHLLCGDISERECRGLQLLVSPSQAQAAQDVLEELGFQRSESLALGSGQQQALLRWGHKTALAHFQSGLELTLSWRLYSCWIGSDLRGFEELWSCSQTLGWEGLSDWSTLGAADTILYLALTGFETGWSDMQQLLDLALGLEILDYNWDEVIVLAGPRAILLERAVEMSVRLLGIPHPQRMTFHFRDYEQVFATWTRWYQSQVPLRKELLSARYWSCHPSEALRRRFVALLTPRPEDIQSVALPETLLFLYPIVRALGVLFSAVRS